MLSDIYVADPSFTYQVGGYSGDTWTYNYTRTLETMFGDGTEFDESILISGNLDCDLFFSINNQRYEYMMVVKDSASSDPNYRKMIVDPAFEGYETAKLLGSCLIQTGNWSSFSLYNLTQMKPLIGAEMKGARFCLGNKVNGFKRLTLFPNSMSVEIDDPQKAGSTTTYAAINYTTTTTLEGIENKTLQSSGFDMKHTERGLDRANNYTFDSNYRPILAFVIKYNDEILLVNATYLISKGDGGVISMYQNGMPVSYAFGKVVSNPDFIQMGTDVTKPQWVARPHLGDVPENDLGLYCQVYTSRSTWYLNQHMLYNGAIVRRLLTISGLFFLWDNTYASVGPTITDFNENLCLGSRDKYGQIKQDGYNKGWSDIVENDEYYDKLDYKDMPTVNPNPPPPPPPEADEESEYGGAPWLGKDSVNIDTGIVYREMTSAQINDFRSIIETLKAYEMAYKQYMQNAVAGGITDKIANDKWVEVFPTAADYTAFIYDKYGYGSDPVNSIISITAFPMNVPTAANLPIKDIGAVDLYIDIPTGYTPSGTVEFVRANYYTAGGAYGTVHSYPLVSSDAFTKNIVDHVIAHPKGYTDFRAYSPYTRLELYIPMHGTIDLDPAVVIGKTLTVNISVTVADGSSIATVLINNTVYQTISGQVGYSIPLSADASSINNLALKTLSINSQSQRLNAIGNIIHGIGSVAGSVATKNYGSAIGSAVDMVLTGQQNAINSSSIKYQIEHATDGKIVVGQPSSLNAFMIHPKCQLIWHLPLMQYYNPETYGRTVGYKCHKTTTLGALTGYTECSNASLDNVSCTEAEKTMILEQLKNGIII